MSTTEPITVGRVFITWPGSSADTLSWYVRLVLLELFGKVKEQLLLKENYYQKKEKVMQRKKQNGSR